eukprot:192443-Amphidinium_carterae.1
MCCVSVIVQTRPLQAVPGARAVSIRQECAWVEAHTQNLVLLLQAVSWTIGQAILNNPRLFSVAEQQRAAHG